MMGDERTLTVPSFVEFGLSKKIRFKEEQITEVLEGRLQINFQDFISLLILASCGGERTKLGLNNFTKLMMHMGVKQVTQAEEFDSGRDDSDDEE